MEADASNYATGEVLSMKLLQVATYWFVIDWLDIQKAQKSEV